MRAIYGSTLANRDVMPPVEPAILESPRFRDLCSALLQCAPDEELLLRFLRDLLTFAWCSEVANRWAAAREIYGGRTVRETAVVLGRRRLRTTRASGSRMARADSRRFFGDKNMGPLNCKHESL